MIICPIHGIEYSEELQSCPICLAEKYFVSKEKPARTYGQVPITFILVDRLTCLEFYLWQRGARLI